MRRCIFLFAALFILFSSARGFAAEPVQFEPPAHLDMGHPVSSDFFRVIATGNGKIISHPGPVFTEGGDYTGMELPYLLSDPKPILYPRWAIRQEWQGDFTIAIEILETGDVGRYKVMQSTGHEVLDEAATQAIQSWKFNPAMKDGKAIVTCVQIPVRFELQSEA